MRSNTVPERSVSEYQRLLTLPLEIDSYALTGCALAITPQFTRQTTVVHLYGGAQEGIGEDVTYEPSEHVAFQEVGASHQLAGRWTLDSFSRRLDALDLFPSEPALKAYRSYRRWAFESAGLDLALRQAGLSLAEALDRETSPTRFVVSPGPETSLAPLHDRLARYPDLRFKLIPIEPWDDAYVAGLAATGAVDVVDLKGQYDAAFPADPALYRRVVEALPDVLIEDPRLNPETEAVLAPHRHRITWDAPIRSVSDIQRLPDKPRMLNIKPSRLGTVRSLLRLYAHCEREGIGLYGGGQFELGPGRGQIQTLASLFHPEAPNDIAPSAYNAVELRDGLPQSPLPACEPTLGFR